MISKQKWQNQVRRSAQVGILLIAIAVCSAGASFGILHLAQPAPAVAQAGQTQPVRASQFQLIGPDGTVRATLGMFNDGPGIVFYGPDGATERVALGTEDTSGNAGITLNDSSGTKRADFGVNPSAGGSGVTLYYPDGQTPDVTVRAPTASGQGHVVVHDSDGQPVAQLP
jgi:hypothetical protein